MTLRQDLLSMTGSSTVLVDVMMAAALTATYAKDAAHVRTTLDFQALLLVVGAASGDAHIGEASHPGPPKQWLPAVFLSVFDQSLFSMSRPGNGCRPLYM